MGDHFQTVIDVEATQEEAERLAPRLVDWLVEQGIVTRELTRDGMYSMGTDVGHLPGPHWARAVSDASDEPDAPGPVAVIVGRNQYCGGQGASEAVSAVCPRCAREIRFIDYQSLVHAVDEDAWRPFCQGIEAWRATGHAGVKLPLLREADPDDGVALGPRLRAGQSGRRLLELAPAQPGVRRGSRAADGAPDRGADREVLSGGQLPGTGRSEELRAERGYGATGVFRTEGRTAAGQSVVPVVVSFPAEPLMWRCCAAVSARTTKMPAAAAPMTAASATRSMGTSV